MQDINRDGDSIEIADLERWRDRIHQAIDQGYVIEHGTNKQIPLDETNGINTLGDVLEASALSPNRQLYGNLHNMGHNLIAYVHDPDNRHLEGDYLSINYSRIYIIENNFFHKDYGIMGDVTTAMRDPIFYRWHAFINSIFVKFKNTLRSYQSNELLFEDIVVHSVDVQITKRSTNTTPNVLLTYWQKSDVDLGAGLDFGPGNVYAQVICFYSIIKSLLLSFVHFSVFCDYSSLTYSTHLLNIE